ncbi:MULTISPECIES: hypothetical protein [Bacillus]|uniref:Secreted protein n=2 Tax=Bacillus TaxID=1386 RepID=A0A0M4GC91_9BACI|nr:MULTISPECIES: hypothetical protein [Bacillus]ALC83528.1 hypothetical protein AM592_19830 [Bacillus gobiensis]MBP1082510.1 hypothetical protein [Bacillus capparidis]MED1097256.1 hypothetical protein [Bacillus capparidis]
MKHKNVWIWFVSAFVYLGLVISGYTVYASMNQTNPQAAGHSDSMNMESEESSGHDEHDEESGSEHSDHGADTKSEVATDVKYNEGLLTIDVKDHKNNPVELEVSHEKIMHLILVSADLKEYHHLHPEEQGNGRYTLKINLSENNYKVFVDIKPKDLAYHVRPSELHVGGDHAGHGENSLQADTNFTKTINGKTVELTTTELAANKNVTLTFDTKGVTPQPYLGALGHVVILDERGGEFIHVHPASNDQTVFKTKFDKPGIYKLWGEFNFDGKVNAYPFVIEVK